jgi:hypothetical protein
MMTIEYRPYKMGSKFFVVLKLIEHHSPPPSSFESCRNLKNREVDEFTLGYSGKEGEEYIDSFEDSTEK